MVLLLFRYDKTARYFLAAVHLASSRSTRHVGIGAYRQLRYDSLLAEEEHQRDSPDGRSHLYERRYGCCNGDLVVFCFIARNSGPSGEISHGYI